MRRTINLSMLCLAVGVVSACEVDTVIETENIPTAGIRFVNAVPDTGAMDFRPVDIVESNHFFAVAFRSGAAIAGGVNYATNIFYKNARAGQRHFRIFMNGNTAAVASTVVKDTVVNLEAGKRYTFILWGFARTGSAPGMRLTVLEDDPADPGTSVALRVVNAAAGLGALDVKHYPSTGGAPATPTWPNVAELSATNYLTAAAGQIRFNVTPAGGGAALFADPLALRGSAATDDREALPGTTIAGSAVSAIIFPRSVAGSQAPQGAGSSTIPNWGLPVTVFVWDRRPARTCTPIC